MELAPENRFARKRPVSSATGLCAETQIPTVQKTNCKRCRRYGGEEGTKEEEEEGVMWPLEQCELDEPGLGASKKSKGPDPLFGLSPTIRSDHLPPETSAADSMNSRIL